MSPLDPSQPWKDPRIRVRRDGPFDHDGAEGTGGRVVVYWMQRAQRAVDNPALDVAIDAGNALGLPVVAFLGVVPFYPHGNRRHYQFLVEGLPDLAAGLASRRVGFVLRRHPDHSLARFCDEVRPALVVGDENPLRETEAWRATAAERLRVPLWTVDADVVVPTKLLLKEQFAARTIRPRIHARLDEFLVAGTGADTDEGRESRARVAWRRPADLHVIDARAAVEPAFLDAMPIDRSVSPVRSWRGGTKAGMAALRRFVRERLDGYDRNRNHPELAGTSELSPYLHFGHLGPRAVALAIRASSAPPADKDAFLEQLIVRRELAINFVRYNPRYDVLAGCEPWAKSALGRHRADPRPVVYPFARIEHADTDDPLWNAAQKQMLHRGWMHNTLRMYWAKKILEWSPSPEDAFATAVTLNDRYFLDGRDPNGYAGIAWAIGGKHDRAWGTRPIFGTIRFMSLASTSKKFDSRRYIAQMEELARSGG